MDGMANFQVPPVNVAMDVPGASPQGGRRRLVGALRSFGCKLLGRREPVRPVDGFIIRDDVHRFVRGFEKRWSARAEGRRDGVRALPRADDASVRPDYVQALLNQAQEAVRAMLTAAHRTAALLTQDLAVRKPDLDARVEQAVAEFRDVRLPRTELHHTGDLMEAHRAHQEALRRFNHFREANGLGGEKPHRARSPLRYVLLATIVLVLEAILNGFAMQDASPTGLRGAAPYGAAVGAANVMLGLVCGHFSRWRYHVRTVPRLAGWTLTLLSAGVGLALQCLMATWRYAATGDVDLVDALHTAGSTLWLHPWLWMGDLQCWLLALLGAVSFGAAFIEAETLTGHPYPGFADVWKRERVAEQYVLDVLVTVAEESKDAMDAASEQLDAVEREAAEDWRWHRHGIAELHRLTRAVQEGAASFSLEINRLRQEYCAANRRVRGDAPLPPYLLRVMGLNVEVPGYGHGNEATEAWLRERSIETAGRVAAAKATMIRLRLGAIARLHGRLKDEDGRPTPEEPSPPLPRPDPASNGGLNFFGEHGKEHRT